MHRILCLGICAGGLLGFASAAQAVVIPNVEAPFNGGLSSPSREAPRVFQGFIDSAFWSEVTEPTTLNGISFRLPPSASQLTAGYPSRDLSFAQYDITLAKPSAAALSANALVSDTFADNMDAAVTVRSGALTIPAGALTDLDTGPGPDEGSAEFSYFIPFTTNYTINPGEDLVVLVRHGGHSGEAEPNLWNFDAYTYTSGGRVATGNANAASGALIPDTVVRFAFSEVPEPSSALLVAGFAACFAARRRRTASPAALPEGEQEKLA